MGFLEVDLSPSQMLQESYSHVNKQETLFFCVYFVDWHITKFKKEEEKSFGPSFFFHIFFLLFFSHKWRIFYSPLFLFSRLIFFHNISLVVLYISKGDTWLTYIIQDFFHYTRK